MENLVVLKRDDLEVLLKQVAANMKAEATAEPARNLKMNIDEALIYLNEQCYPISKSTMYKHTMAGTIPFSRFGERKILFDVNELDQWISKRLIGNDATGGDEITNKVAENARKKGRA
ncbi:MAG: helix-turn-helix domain-containing protein [Candidatus Paceibacterota bacterium]|jgi:excisionase family DNA binding protein